MSNARAAVRRKIRRGEPVTSAEVAAAFPNPSEPEYQEGGKVVVYKMMDPKLAAEKLRMLEEAQSKGLLVAGEIAQPSDPTAAQEKPPIPAEAQSPVARSPVAPVDDEMALLNAPGPWSRAKAVRAGGTRSPSPSNKCPDPTCVWPNEADATVCVRCGQPLAESLQQTASAEERLLEVLSLFSPEQRRALLNVLSLPDEERATTIGEVHKRGGGSAAELLIDLEEDPIRRIKVLSMLQVLE
jgi:hypothetical protein